ncbi:MAG: hypothetical protein EOO39_00615 [Cytophagaceae bacterium]|nr:MAG: hypothetical protein EOO39_00615 [Cytophagaceae bacterium]
MKTLGNAFGWLFVMTAILFFSIGVDCAMHVGQRASRLGYHYPDLRITAFFLIGGLFLTYWAVKLIIAANKN